MKIPMLPMSGSPEAEKLLEGDPTPFLAKPFRLVDFEREINNLLYPRRDPRQGLGANRQRPRHPSLA